jgi:hypothetical protein
MESNEMDTGSVVPPTRTRTNKKSRQETGWGILEASSLKSWRLLGNPDGR